MAKTLARRQRLPDQHRAVVLGIPGILLGLGPAMIAFNFWVGATISTVAAVLLIYLFFHLFGRNELRKRKIGISVTVLGYGVILWAIWVPNSVSPLVYIEDAKFKEGEELYDIKWKEQFYFMSLILSNNSNNYMTNLDIYVRTDLTIATIGIAPGINSCSKETVLPGIFATIGITKPTDGTGNAVPMLEQGKMSATMWRLRCERLSGNSKLEIILPIINNAPAMDRKKPAWAKVWVSAMAGYRPFSFPYEECFIKPCHRIPRTIYGESIPSFSPWSVVGYVAFVQNALLPGLRLGSLQ
jgi:hypothetical protein